MASSKTLREMEENFFLCSICLDQFKEPKLLPCLHRYCRDCLQIVINKGRLNKIQCPLCKDQYPIPNGGVDGFKTDFHMKSMIEFIQSQNTVENVDSTLKRCISCSSKTTFLICCGSCGNLPVCEACIKTSHQGHDLYDVTELSKIERESLRLILDEMKTRLSHLYDLKKRGKACEEELKCAAAIKKEELQRHHQEQVKHAKNEIDKNNVGRERELADVESERHSHKYQLDVKMEEEINLVRMKYEDLKRTADDNYDSLLKQVNLKYDGIGRSLYKILSDLDSNLTDVNNALEALTKKKESKLKEIPNHCKQVFERYENFKATSSSIFASNDEWTDVQCIPDIKSASGSLLEEMKKEFLRPDMIDLSRLSLLEMPIPTVTCGDVTAAASSNKSVIHVEGIKANGWLITGMAGHTTGDITITGRVSENASHIMVLDKYGKIQRCEEMHSESSCTSLSLHRYCSTLLKFKVATVCRSDEIGIYDTRDGSYVSKNISDVVGNWPMSRCVTCVTFDPVKNHIIVGTSSRYVYVFDDQLNYCHTITLPDVINELIDLAVHRGNLLVCDTISKRSYMVTVEESEGKLKNELTNPRLKDGNWRPVSVCTDKKGFIYLLWKAFASGRSRCLLLEYNQDGLQLLTSTPVDGDARSVATLETDTDDKLLISTYKSGQLYIADLVEPNGKQILSTD